MKTICFCLALAFISYFQAAAQSSVIRETPSEKPIMKGFLTYAEIMGTGKGVTVNFEKPLFPLSRKWYCSGAVGFGALNGSVPFRSVPVGLYAFSMHEGLRKEIGLSIGYVQGQEYSENLFPKTYSESLFVTPALGLRYQKGDGGFFFRLNYTPYIKVKEYTSDKFYNSLEGKLRHSFGGSAGWYFLRSK